MYTIIDKYRLFEAEKMKPFFIEYIEQFENNIWVRPRVRHLEPYVHLHSNIEVIYMRRGTALAHIDGQTTPIGDGDVCIVFPNLVHSYTHERYSSDTSLYILSPEMYPEFENVLKHFSPKCPVINTSDSPELCRILDVLASYDTPKTLYTAAYARGMSMAMMSLILEQLELEENPANHTSHSKAIIDYCYKNFTTDISLQSIADALHLNRQYVSRLFTQKLKIGFNDHINFLRIEKACEMLKSSQTSIIDITYAVGYNSSRTFNRCFKAIRGVTPKAYRENALTKTQTNVPLP